MGCQKDNFRRCLLSFVLQETFNFWVSLRNMLLNSNCKDKMIMKKSCHSADLSIFLTFFCVKVYYWNSSSFHSRCFLLSIQVLFYEMRGIQKACTELEKNYQPKITFIVTVKRHHGRFAVINERNKVDCSLSFIYLFV